MSFNKPPKNSFQFHTEDDIEDNDERYHVRNFFSQVLPSTTSGSTPNTHKIQANIEDKHDKQFNDPVHGFIYLEPMLVKVIDTPYFQRLRNLKQLGAGYYVFPGASHNRFEHSIGTAHIAGVMAEHLRQVDHKNELHLTDRIILLVKLAGLLHDLGHGPFSHVFDGLFIPDIIKRCTNDTNPANKAHNDLLIQKLSNWTHEDASEMMLEKAIETAGLTDPIQYSDPLTDNEILFVKQMINPKRYQSQIFPQYGFCYDIISNSRCSIDVDKFDYIQRDCLNCGVTCAVRFERLLQHCKVIDNQVCFDKNISWDVVELFHARYSLFKQIYSHRKVKSVEYMIADALCEADKTLHIAERVMNADSYLSLDDSIIHEIEFYPLEQLGKTLQPSQRQGMEKAQAILKRLRLRQLYRYCAETLLPSNHDSTLLDQITEESVCKFVPNTSQLNQDNIILQKFSLNYANKDKNPVDHVKFYNYHRQDTAFDMPSSKVSLLIPRVFTEKYIRIFIRLDDRNEQVVAAQALRQALETVLENKEHVTGTSFNDIDSAIPLIEVNITGNDNDQINDDSTPILSMQHSTPNRPKRILSVLHSSRAHRPLTFDEQNGNTPTNSICPSTPVIGRPSASQSTPAPASPLSVPVKRQRVAAYQRDEQHQSRDSNPTLDSDDE